MSTTHEGVGPSPLAGHNYGQEYDRPHDLPADDLLTQRGQPGQDPYQSPAHAQEPHPVYLYPFDGAENPPIPGTSGAVAARIAARYAPSPNALETTISAIARMPGPEADALVADRLTRLQQHLGRGALQVPRPERAPASRPATIATPPHVETLPQDREVSDTILPVDSQEPYVPYAVYRNPRTRTESQPVVAERVRGRHKDTRSFFVRKGEKLNKYVEQRLERLKHTTLPRKIGAIGLAGALHVGVLGGAAHVGTPAIERGITAVTTTHEHPTIKLDNPAVKSAPHAFELNTPAPVTETPATKATPNIPTAAEAVVKEPEEKVVTVDAGDTAWGLAADALRAETGKDPSRRAIRALATMMLKDVGLTFSTARNLQPEQHLGYSLADVHAALAATGN